MSTQHTPVLDALAAERIDALCLATRRLLNTHPDGMTRAIQWLDSQIRWRHAWHYARIRRDQRASTAAAMLAWEFAAKGGEDEPSPIKRTWRERFGRRVEVPAVGEPIFGSRGGWHDHPHRPEPL